MLTCPRYVERIVDGVRVLECQWGIAVTPWTVFGFRIMLVGLGVLFIALGGRLFLRWYRHGITRAEFAAWWQKFIRL